MHWIKSHRGSGTIKGNIGKGEVEDKGVVEGTKTHQSAFAVEEIISSMIVLNYKIFVKSTIKRDSKGRETPSLAASYHRECRPGWING